MCSSSDLGNLVHRNIELLRLEKTFKIIKSNCQISTTTFTIKPYPQVQISLFWVGNTLTLI